MGNTGTRTGLAVLLCLTALPFEAVAQEDEMTDRSGTVVISDGEGVVRLESGSGGVSVKGSRGALPPFEDGDVITRVGGSEARTPEDVFGAMRDESGTVPVEVMRGGAKVTLDVEAASIRDRLPAEPPETPERGSGPPPPPPPPPPTKREN
jgi:S1-C subfamily serine protease